MTSIHSSQCAKSVRVRSYSGPHFPPFRLNMERYGVSLHIQSEFGILQTRITPTTDNFHAVSDRRKVTASYFMEIFVITKCNKL